MSDENKIYDPYAEADEKLGVNTYEEQFNIDIEGMSVEDTRLYKTEPASMLVNFGAHMDEKVVGAASSTFKRFMMDNKFDNEGESQRMLDYANSDQVKLLKQRGVTDQHIQHALENADSLEEMEFMFKDLTDRVLPAQQVQGQRGFVENLVFGITADLPVLAGSLLTTKNVAGVGRTLVALPATIKRTETLGKAIRLANKSSAIKGSKLARIGKTKKELALEFGSAGVLDSLAVNLRNEVANYDDPDYLKDAALEGAIGVALGGLFGRSAGVTKQANKQGGNVRTVDTVDNDAIDVAVVAEEEALAITEEGLSHAIMFTGNDITAGNVRSSLDTHINKTQSNLDVVETDIADLERRVKESEKITDDVRKQVESDNAADVAKAESKVVYKKEDSALNKGNDLIKKGHVKKVDRESLVNFIDAARGKLSKVLPDGFTPNKKVKATRQMIADAKGNTDLYDAVNSAQKLVDDIDAKANIDVVKQNIEGKVKEATADNVKETNKLNKKLAELKKQRKKLKGIINKANTDKEAIADLVDDDVIDHSMETYVYFSRLDPNKIPPTLPTKVINDIREVAEQMGDNEVLAALDNVRTAEGYHVGGMTPEQVAQHGEIESSNAGKNKGIFQFLHTTGNILSRSNSPISRGIGNLLVNANLGNIDKSVSTNAASTFAEDFKREYTNILNDAIVKGQNAYFERIGVKLRFKGQGGMMWNHPKSYEFNDLVYRAASMIGMKGKEADLAKIAEQSPEAVQTAKELQKLMVRARTDLAKAHPNMTHGERHAALQDLDKSFMSRVRNDDWYKRSESIIDEADHIDVHEGAMLKATPDMNFKIELGVLLRKQETGQVLTKSQLDRVAHLEKRIEEVNADLEAGLMDDDAVRRLMEETGEKRYSNMIAKNFYKNQLQRSKGNTIAERADSKDMMAMLDEAGVKLDDTERHVLELWSNKEISKGKATDPFQQRMPMDLTYSKQIVTKDGEARSMEMFEYYDTHAQGVMAGTVRKYSGLYGLHKGGFSDFDEFDTAINAAKAEAETLKGLERYNVKLALDKTQKFFKSEAQYDRSHPIWQYVDLAKNTMAATKLAFLPLSMGIEAWNIVSYNGFRNTMNAIGATKFANDLRAGRLEMNDGMGALYMAIGNTLDPIENFIIRNEAGIDDFGGSANPIATMRDKMATYASYTNYMSKKFDANIRAINFQAQLNKLMTTPIEELSSQLYKNHGMTDSIVDHIKMLRDSKYVTVDAKGNVVDFKYNDYIKDFPDESKDFMASFSRLSDRAIQTNRFSDLPPWANSAMFGWLGQFKSFMLGAHSNQLLYHLSNPSMITATMFTGQMALSYMMYVARTQYMYGDDEKKLEEMLDPRVAAAAAFRGTGFGALLSTIIGTTSGLVLGVDPFAYGSTTGQQASSPRSMQFFDQATPVRFLKDHLVALSLVGHLALGGKPSESDARTVLSLYIPTTVSAPLSKLTTETFDLRSRSKNILQEIYQN